MKLNHYLNFYNKKSMEMIAHKFYLNMYIFTNLKSIFFQEFTFCLNLD